MSARKLRNAWWVDFRFGDTRHRLRSPINTRAGALQYETTLRGRIMRGEEIYEIPKPKMTFRDHAEDWFTTYVCVNNKPSEQHSKRITLNAHLLPAFGQVPLKKIGGREIEQYKAKKLASGLAAKTVNNHIAILRRCLRSAVEWGRLDILPPAKLISTISAKIDFLSEYEVARLLESVRGASWDLMALTALHTGMRLGELFALDWSDVDLVRDQIVVRRAVSDGIITDTKTHRIRHIPITEKLKSHLITIPHRKGLIFRREDNGALSRRSADCAIHRICRLAGIRTIGWHVLRHTFASRLVALGVPIRAVQLLLGHSTITMTERYSHFAPLHLRSAIVGLDQMDFHPLGQPVGNALMAV